MARVLFYFKGLIWLGALVLILTACKPKGLPPATLPVASAASTNASVGSATLTPSPVLPSGTPAPMAARVNGVGITLAEYEAELAQYQAASGKDPLPEDKQRVLNDLIDQTLLAQAAAEKSFVVDETIYQEHLKRLVDQLGGQAVLSDWMAAHGYKEDSFHQALVRSIATAWMRDQIIASVPKSAEQIHARQILLYNADQANQVYAQLQAGNDFGNLAVKYDPITGGDLGWFPRGYLLDPKLEEAAFNLKPNEYSSVIETPAGFHILQVIEQDPQRLLVPGALLVLQNQALQKWLEARRSASDIQILVS